ncbi:MAG: ABC-type glutathione transport system ATPase component [Phenylobacterium sp.]|jgi:ABC-type glutathione transport system ATPase component
MFITKFSLTYANPNTTVSEICFNKLNVLVGVSGAGKTTIMNALFSVIQIAQGKSYPLESWEMTFVDNKNRKVNWQGRFTTAVEQNKEEETTTELLEEKLIIAGDVIFDKANGKTTYKGNVLPVLEKYTSNIYLLREDETIKSIYDSLESIIIVYNNSHSHTESINASIINETHWDKAKTFFSHNKKSSINELHRSLPAINSTEKLFFASQFDLASFDNFNFIYTSIFDNVKSITPQIMPIYPEKGTASKRKALHFTLALKDGSVIEQFDISSGMYKTMMLLAELLLSSDNTVLLIDEIENSLGINCLPDIIQEIKSAPFQCIISTHHPKIINDIPAKSWKIVNRKGAVIHADDATDIANSSSHHDPFIQLLNNTIYQNGNA